MDNNEILFVYDFLETCVKQKNSSEWNTYRRKNRKLEISLHGMKFASWEISGFNFKGISFQGADFSEASFENCVFDQCPMDELQAFGASFRSCSFVSASLQKANLVTAYFEDCDLRYGDFSESRIHQSNILRCKAEDGKFIGVSFYDTNINECEFMNGDFSSAQVRNVEMYQSDFTAATVDGATVFWDCYYDRRTNFTGVGLNGCRVEPVLMSSFQCNIRRIWWMNWYADKKEDRNRCFHNFARHPIRHLPSLFKGIGEFIMNGVVKLFWWITDYGSSTVRLILVFLGIASLYALSYVIYPDMTNDDVLKYSPDVGLVAARALYFSVIVMTGLGFGEIAPNSSIFIGHVVVLLQSLTGYILLGAFLVRIGILFQGEFPVSAVRRRKKGQSDTEEKQKKREESQ